MAVKKKKSKLRLKDLDLEESNIPWEDSGLDSKIIKSFLLRIPEPYHLKIKILARHLKYDSMHDLCWQVIEQYIDKEIDRITNDESELKELKKTLARLGGRDSLIHGF